MAVEEAGTAHSGYLKPNTSKIVGVDFEEIGRFDRGRKLFNTLLNTKFEGNKLKKKLKIGVPVRNGFNEYVKVEWKPPNNKIKISGFSKEVFKEVIKVLEFPPYEFVPFEKNHQSAGTYNELLHNLTNKPLNWNLWLTSAIGFAVTGFVVWVLEHRTNTEFRGPIKHQLGKTLWGRLKNNLSKFVLIIWIFVVLILTQSYTASLTSMLTVQRLRPSFDDVKEIRASGYLVGYPKDSFVKDFLINKLNLNESNLKGYEYPKDYDEALSNQSVAAIFDEIPFIKLFLAKYCSKYMMVGPTYRTGGLGFVSLSPLS
ncbi:hypothetical protein Patl1_14393 [Pistacia atlantica]|uniref:Uncharacterized protein n=1 Tax=Pistacia atlantica TaxID=434234 RepID=A0ACC1AX98_9ROSI|nr:hypothetical protein Patl1_14393 [Pistacia atlantica]